MPTNTSGPTEGIQDACDTARGPRARIASRAVALFFGGFGALNVMAGLFVRGFDANVWWIDLRPLPAWLTQPFLLLASLTLLAYALRTRIVVRRVWPRRLVAVAVALALWNAVGFWVLLAQGRIVTAMPVPLSFFVAGALAFVAVNMRRTLPARITARAGRMLLFLAALASVCFLFTVAQMFCFGRTDYRRPADVVVVFGAGVTRSGAPSLALYDRMRTAIGLVRSGLASRIIVSGGPGPGRVHETQTMRRLALEAGVPDKDIIVDPRGLNTRATVRNTARMFSRLHLNRVLAVSHFYHLPRVKMAFQRAGLEVFTVPARESRPLAAMPWYMAREVAAFWSYYLRLV